jgi:hypothetical protein
LDLIDLSIAAALVAVTGTIAVGFASPARHDSRP